MIRAAIVSLVMGAASVSLAAEEVSVGFGKADITPKVGGAAKAVWIAGYGMGREAIGVHDALFVRALVFKSGGKKIAMAVADLVGLQYPVILKIREKLADFDYVLVSSTHVHEGPDVVGLWGEKPLKSGVDPEYIDLVIAKTVEAIKAAEAAAVPASATYGTVVDEELLRDSRKPYVKDGIIRVVLFKDAKGKNSSILLQQNSHPESLTDKNQYLTTDFLYFTIKALEEKYHCPVAAFSGAVGGLMTVPNRIKSDEGKEVNDGNFEYAEIYGNRLAKRAIEAIESAKPISISPINAAAQVCYVPIDNNVFKFAFRSGTMSRDAYVWNDDPWSENPEPLESKSKIANKRGALKTEVGYIKIGDIHVAGIPGEGYPESIYGKFQEPVEPNADFPNAPLETPVVKALPGEHILVIGLANDEIGYIIPKRQWDFVAPFAYGMNKYQYGEVNSVGPESAPVVYGSLEKAVKKATQK